MATPTGWRPTAALGRAVGTGGGLLLVAVLLRRADLVVLAGPLLIGAALALAGRPHGAPSVRLSVPSRALLEGQRITATVTVSSDDAADALDVAAVVLTLPTWLDATSGVSPPARAVIAGAGAHVDVPIEVRTRRWGRRPAGPATVHATGAYGLLRWPPVTSGVAVTTTWPLGEGFGATDTVPRAQALVGTHRSRRPGEGGDVAGVRPFIPGDRLRRVNWRVTGRTGELHVTATYADRDAEVLLCLDSRQDLGRPPDSCLDTGVRATAAIAEHYLRAGDRVGLVDLGQRYRPVPARNGRNHLVRILDVLLDTKPVRDGAGSSRATGMLAAAELTALAAADALVVLLSPLAGPAPLQAVAALAHAGRPVVAVDTLPPTAVPDQRGDYTELAFRLWRLRRELDLLRLAELGVPVVPWRGAGSLDLVLQDVSRAARAPRVTR
ncbi:MAG TPA: DUF58 domain-containing protein [Mycobacteriales bacterium]|nr:DUF58 domain-containing protein [Mycobacteriales bacterium]